MPFAADALAAAVARQTGSQVIVPPNPGAVGALGIALLARRSLAWDSRSALDLARFLAARVEQKATFVCQATVGCGGTGNRWRIDSLKTLVREERQVFRWGGACALYDKGTRRVKRGTGRRSVPRTRGAGGGVHTSASAPLLAQAAISMNRTAPDRAPSRRAAATMFARVAVVSLRPLAPPPKTISADSRQRVAGSKSCGCAGQSVGSLAQGEPAALHKRSHTPRPPSRTEPPALSCAGALVEDEFMLKGLFPFFATYLHELGFELLDIGGATRRL